MERIKSIQYSYEQLNNVFVKTKDRNYQNHQIKQRIIIVIDADIVIYSNYCM